MPELLLNHVLFFMSNKIHSLDKERILDICAKFYSDFEEINEAKRILYEKNGKKFTQRRSDDKTVQTLSDIYDTLFTADRDGVVLPVFVASDFTHFPLTNDGSVNLEQILHSMNTVNSRLNALQRHSASKEAQPEDKEQYFVINSKTKNSDNNVDVVIDGVSNCNKKHAEGDVSSVGGVACVGSID